MTTVTGTATDSTLEDVDVATITSTVLETVVVSVTSAPNVFTKRTPELLDLPMIPTAESTADAMEEVIKRSDPRQKQWESCLKKNSWAAVSTICNCLSPKVTITRTITPKVSTATATTVITRGATSTTTFTTTAVSIQTSTPVVEATSTTTLTETTTPEDVTISTTTTGVQTAPTITVTVSREEVVTIGYTETTATTLPTTATITTTTTVTPVSLPAGTNVLKNPSLETTYPLSGSSYRGISDWIASSPPADGRIYTGTSSRSSHEGNNYGVMQYRYGSASGSASQSGPLSLSQPLTNLDTTRVYTLSFWFFINTINGNGYPADTGPCYLKASLDGTEIYSYTPASQADVPKSYRQAISRPVSSVSSNALLKISWDCDFNYATGGLSPLIMDDFSFKALAT